MRVAKSLMGYWRVESKGNMVVTAKGPYTEEQIIRMGATRNDIETTEDFVNSSGHVVAMRDGLCLACLPAVNKDFWD